MCIYIYIYSGLGFLCVYIYSGLGFRFVLGFRVSGLGLMG